MIHHRSWNIDVTNLAKVYLSVIFSSAFLQPWQSKSVLNKFVTIDQYGNKERKIPRKSIIRKQKYMMKNMACHFLLNLIPLRFIK